MYIESVPNRNSPPAVLLRESYRGEDGKVKKRTVANLSSLKPEVIEGLRVLLKGGSAADKPLEDQFKVERTLPHGHVAAALGMFSKLGMFPLLERKRSEERSLAAALIISRLLDPGSKLALSRQLSGETATSTLGEELGLDEKISEKDFPGERLVVCMNPALREERARKRTELLEVTERKLQKISDACTRSRNPYRGKDRIARRVEREAGKYKMLKHFKLSFTETGLNFERDESSIAEESALDGLYVVRAKDEVPGGAPRSSPVAKARRSEAAEAKAASQQTADGLCVHGFKTLLEELATLCRVTIRPDIKNADAFFKLTEPTQIQEKVFNLLEFKPRIAPCSQ